MRTTPDQVRLILVDPKRVELGQYNNVPHLLTEVVDEPEEGRERARLGRARDGACATTCSPRSACATSPVTTRCSTAASCPTEDEPDPMTGKSYERLPFIVIVVDELDDLMMVAARDVESEHLPHRADGPRRRHPSRDRDAATVGRRDHRRDQGQHPEPARVRGEQPRRLAVILDQPGAEKLVGKGDMLLLTASSSRTERIQGAWVDEDCVRKVVAHWRRQTITTRVRGGRAGRRRAPAPDSVDDDEGDELLEQAMELVVRAGWARQHVDAAAQAAGGLRAGPGASWTSSSGGASSDRPRDRSRGPC